MSVCVPTCVGRNKKEERLRCVESFAIAKWKLWRSGKRVELTAVRLAKVTAASVRTYYKLYTGGRLELIHYHRDAASKKNVLAAWKATLKAGWKLWRS